jgi:sarcosine oxidase
VRRCEFLVVGAGLLGLATARALAQRGRDVVVAEQDTVGHEKAGSKGAVRIFRLGYTSPLYVAMADRAEGMWRELEHESGLALLRTTGQVTFGDGIDDLVQAMSDVGVGCEVLAEGQAAIRFPGLRVPGRAVFEPRSGVLAASACLEALRRVGGAEVRQRTAVTDISDDGRRVRVRLGAEDVSASVVVLCCGPWTSTLLSRLGVSNRLSATAEQVAYLAPIAGRDSKVPIFVEWGRPTFYGLPAGQQDLLKVGFHGLGPIVDADAVEMNADPALLQMLAAASDRLLPGFDSGPVSTERCLYDNSPDEDFVLDRIGRVVIGAGTSGHGFKFGPLLGELLADLATWVPPSVDLHPFRLSRDTLIRKRS